MNLSELIRAFADDPGVRIAAVLVALDFVLGVTAAVVRRTFRIGWLSDFLRRDVLGKLVPYFALWAAVRVSGDLTIPGFEIGAIEEGANAMLVLAMTGSILNSLRDLGLLRSAPDAVAGSDTPPPAP